MCTYKLTNDFNWMHLPCGIFKFWHKAYIKLHGFGNTRSWQFYIYELLSNIIVETMCLIFSTQIYLLGHHKKVDLHYLAMLFMLQPHYVFHQMSSFVVPNHPHALHQMMLCLAEKHVPSTTISYVGHNIHFSAMLVTFMSLCWVCKLDILDTLSSLWRILAHLPHEDMHSQNSLGGGTIM